jgi:hypothetical protein
MIALMHLGLIDRPFAVAYPGIFFEVGGFNKFS